MMVNDLWNRTVAVTRRALERGVLEPLATDHLVIEDSGIPFVVHVLARLERKQRARREQQRTGSNPFLPPDPDLVVADVSSSHVCVLNRFNVLDHHLLIVTRHFEDQLELLDLGDFEALAACMARVNGLAFYNGGAVAGASQPHKHLQLVPVPLGSGPLPTPMDVVLQRLQPSPGVVSSPHLPFPHAVALRDGSSISKASARQLYDGYRELLAALGITGPGRPYNLLVTRHWMLAVPRRAEFFHEISVNALGFAGSLLVRDRRQLDVIRRPGPLAVLAAVAG